MVWDGVYKLMAKVWGELLISSRWEEKLAYHKEFHVPLRSLQYHSKEEAITVVQPYPLIELLIDVQDVGRAHVFLRHSLQCIANTCHPKCNPLAIAANKRRHLLDAEARVYSSQDSSMIGTMNSVIV
jgi:hypothetical protein